jgi:hypothetical protein
MAIRMYRDEKYHPGLPEAMNPVVTYGAVEGLREAPDYEVFAQEYVLGPDAEASRFSGTPAFSRQQFFPWRVRAYGRTWSRHWLDRARGIPSDLYLEGANLPDYAEIIWV